MDHAGLAEVRDLNPSVAERTRIGITLVTHRIKLGSADNGWRQPLQAGRPERRSGVPDRMKLGTPM
jgi:hypothetical protein